MMVGGRGEMLFVIIRTSEKEVSRKSLTNCSTNSCNAKQRPCTRFLLGQMYKETQNSCSVSYCGFWLSHIWVKAKRGKGI